MEGGCILKGEPRKVVNMRGFVTGLCGASATIVLSGCVWAASIPSDFDLAAPRAIHRFADEAELQPSTAAEFAARGDAAFGEVDYKRAAGFYSQAARLAPGVSAYRMKLGEAYERQAESSAFPPPLVRRARNNFEEALRIDPKNAEALAGLTALSLQPVGACYGDLEESRRMVERLKRLDAQLGARAALQLENARKDRQTPEQRVVCGYSALSGLFAGHSKFGAREEAALQGQP